MKKAIVIYNPISGKGLGQKAADAIRNSQLNELYDLTIHKTEYGGHAKEIVFKALNEGFRYFIAVGGDGTINEVGSVLKNKDAVLGMIPMGSGNGLAKHIGMSTDIEKQFCNYAMHQKAELIHSQLMIAFLSMFLDLALMGM